MSIQNINNTTPAAPSGLNVSWQADSADPRNISAYVPPVVGDSGSGGTAGLVPAPPAGSAAAGKFLKADGAFSVPARPTPNVTVLSSGSGTFTLPAGTWNYMRVRMAGGGGGGASSGTSVNSGVSGGNTTFGAMTAGGGGYANSLQFAGVGGSASGGTINVIGGDGGTVNNSPTPSQYNSGATGGASFFGGGGRGGLTGAGVAARCFGSGGGGGGSNATAVALGAGGGAGGYCETWMAPASTSYGVGAGGAGGTAGPSGYAGGAGAPGVIIIELY